ncbi:hypothetical protein PYW08_010341 [Mythimna loreyi]|uniref:Uncharacterized protein n=1 Tax=Mythimna loreyi TaxID=667449 RepID=A0ACC2Q478_9NEOP|nr:hypothetical protein PYW08_010341 [Mythimna loreyi]
MANTLDLKLVLKHLSNGTLGENLCINCLKPLQDQYENIFTKVCKYDKEYCIADVLRIMCDVELSSEDNYNVCVNCFMMASMAYKFYLLSKRSNEIINFYTNELLNNLDEIELPEETANNTLCISLPEILTETPIYDFNLHAIGKDTKNETAEPVKIKTEAVEKEGDDNIVVIIQDNNVPLFYRIGPDGNLTLLGESEAKKYTKSFNSSMTGQNKTVKVERAKNDKEFKFDQPKRGRKRGPMTLKLCSRCPVKYRFIAKLKEHMKSEHDVILYVCEVCKALTEDEQEYHNHLRTHTNIHQCAICNMVFKKRVTIIKHLKRHEKMKNIAYTDSAHICEKCGKILEDEESLRQHYDTKHHKKFTCYYCGRMYKGEMSFDMHIKKHEQNIETGKYRHNVYKKNKTTPNEKPKPVTKRCMCSTCGKHFVDERALLWHQRLHNNERPYICNECGRGFVSVNRRNQHALCAHTAPARRCPLCPALFHLRSMVNTHVKKVHLKQHKRRNRMTKHQNVFWRTEPVPIQELSVEIQNDILELQAANKEQDWTYQQPNYMVPSPTHSGRMDGI